ncbi:MAG: FAD-dependent oxidoreductase [Phormidesmis sp.]
MADGIDGFDVLVVGGGAAGLYSALCLPANYRVALITKDTLTVSASDWAQGGIAAAIAPDDSSDLHVADTLRAGAGLCEPDAVKLLVEEARTCIESLVDLGVAFDRQNQQLSMTLEAAHSRKRVLHAADTTGHAIVSTLAQQVLKQENIQVFEQTFALDLWVETGVCKGIRLAQSQSQAEAQQAESQQAESQQAESQTETARQKADQKADRRLQIRWMPAQAVVLATGGGGQVFSQTTNPTASTGDGIAMAWRAGAELRDLEFFQFHPTALTLPGAPRFLISEAVRGEGAHLLDAQGHRFAFDYHPDGELAPRDVVSRAIFSHLQKTKDSEVVYLDLSPIDPERIQYRFPNIIRVCKHWGIDLFKQPIPVSPAAHYWMGGITADLNSETTIKNLYAVGENASTGVHGANRLASNSLLECLVYGAQLKRLKLDNAPAPAMIANHTLEESWLAGDWRSQLTRWHSDLPALIWKSAGISRDRARMEAAILQVAQWQAQYQQLSITQALALTPGKTLTLPKLVTAEEVRLWGEVGNLLAIAALILKSACFRTESRGGHYRSDYPKPQADWLVHTLVQSTNCKQSMSIADNASS